jgi:hypothetical protein
LLDSLAGILPSKKREVVERAREKSKRKNNGN